MAIVREMIGVQVEVDRNRTPTDISHLGAWVNFLTLFIKWDPHLCVFFAGNLLYTNHFSHSKERWWHVQGNESEKRNGDLSIGWRENRIGSQCNKGPSVKKQRQHMWSHGFLEPATSHVLSSSSSLLRLEQVFFFHTWAPPTHSLFIVAFWAVRAEDGKGCGDILRMISECYLSLRVFSIELYVN